jgi:hypothetical protein
MKNGRLYTKNRQTGKGEVIEQHDIAMESWGFHFFVDGELEAYKAAYLYRDSKHGVVVEFAGSTERWMVTVFNEQGAKSGLDGSRQ